ncbi:LNX2, partial [Symbiodinium microadriaticum]
MVQQTQPDEISDPRGEREGIAALDLWRVHLEQCPDCGHVHGSQGAGKFATVRPERHIYEYTQAVPDDLNCTLCGDVFQNPSQIPCGHHFCSSCIRALLARGTGRANCPLDGQIVTRFAALPSDEQLLRRLGQLRVRCPVCREEICVEDLQLHLQDPVSMVESAEAYQSILQPFYMSCPLSNFTVGEFNGTSALIRLYRKLGPDLLKRFVLATESFIVLPDPKMGFQPQSEDDANLLRREGGYFNAWWVHPTFRREVWWHAEEAAEVDVSSARSPVDSASLVFREAVRKRDAGRSLLGSSDCSSEPWHQSSFVHTWSKVRKPTQPRYLCCARDLRGEDLPMLEQFYKDVLNFLQVQYSVPETRIWIFAHYPASARYSTLHFHIIFDGSEAGRFSKYAKKLERPHQLSRQFSLEKLIELIRADPDHFKSSTL